MCIYMYIYAAFRFLCVAHIINITNRRALSILMHFLNSQRRLIIYDPICEAQHYSAFLVTILLYHSVLGTKSFLS